MHGLPLFVVRCFLSGTTFFDHFSALDDPRQAGKVVYPLAEILLLVLCGTIAGAETFVEIERWGEGKLEFRRRFLPFAHGLPAHDTLNDVINALPSSGFAECFTAWADSLREAQPDLLAMDGKTSRRARRGEAHPLPLVSAWANGQHLVPGQEAVAEKSNEITAIPLLRERLEWSGALVTMDALGCQRAIAETIRAPGADYLLARQDQAAHPGPGRAPVLRGRHPPDIRDPRRRPRSDRSAPPSGPLRGGLPER
jgi:DDE_Tnp_1-associated